MYQFIHLELYKFMGDGWVLLLPEDTQKDVLLEFLDELAKAYFYYYPSTVVPILQKDPRPVGLTVGIDAGELIKVEMNEQYEYLGRPINIASRLQGKAKSAKSKTEIFTNVALFSRTTFNSLTPDKCDFPVSKSTVDLKNITGGNKFHCFVVRLGNQ